MMQASVFDRFYLPFDAAGGGDTRPLICTFEYFHPYAHYPEALIFQTSDSLDRMLGRK